MPDPFRITAPGFYPDISAADYHADPCPRPSLTQSVAKILLERAPLHAWHAHPRLNPDWREDADTKFDVGNIAHALLLSRGKEIVVVDGFDDWRTKEARAARARAAEQGKLAVLGKHAKLAGRMVEAAREQLKLRRLSHLFQDGQGEVCIAWQEGNLWCRQLLDWLTPDRLIVADFKTTDLSAAPQNLPRMMASAGWPIQAAMADRGLDALHPESRGRRSYLFVVQETEAPYALQVVEIGKDVLTMGRKRLDMAVDIWRRCIIEDLWPGYPLEIVTPELPGWTEQQWLDAEIQHAAAARVPLGEVLNAG